MNLTFCVPYRPLSLNGALFWLFERNLQTRSFDGSKPASSGSSDPRDLKQVSFDAEWNCQIFGTMFRSC